MVTQRQKLILEGIIQEYLNLAEPVSSLLLSKKYDFGISPAMIRIEMNRLTKNGYLHQPHTAAGRIPTDKGYRFFVDELLKDEESQSEETTMFQALRNVDDSFLLLQAIARQFASLSSDLIISSIEDQKFLWKEGWVNVLNEPEFEDAGQTIEFIRMIDSLEKNVEELFFDLPPSKVQVYIGRENPFSKTSDFSLIISRFNLVKKGGGQGIFGLAGPKRMAYKRNISLVRTLSEQLEKL